MATAHPVLGKVPHALSLARAAIVLVTYLAAARQDKPLFAVLVLLAVLTDVLDGPFARAYGTESRFGANVDSAADMMFYLSLPAWAFLFDPRIVLDNIVLVIVFGTLYIIANIVSHATFGAMGVHNKLSRGSGTLGVLFAFTSILWGIDTTLYMLLYYAVIAMLAADLAQRFGAVMRARRERRAPV